MRYIRTNFVPDRNRDYITPGKLYPIPESEPEDRGAWFIADDGAKHYAYFPRSAHLDDHAWEVVDCDQSMSPKKGGWLTRFRSWARSLF